MSETAKTADTARRVIDQTTKSSQSAIEGANRTSKESINEAGQMARNATDRAKELGLSMTETVAETANAATEISSRAAEQGREALRLGVQTAAGVSGRVADINFGRSHHLMSSAAQAMDIYRDASERSAERVQALVSSAMSMGRGLQTLQHAWLEMIDKRMEHSTRKPQDLLRCKSMVELAEVQRDLYVDAVNHALASTSRLLEIAGRTAQDAVRPLQPHHH